MRPFINDMPQRPQIVEKPNNTNANISAGPKPIATFDTKSTDTIIMIRLKIPPKTETMTAVPKARDASPFLVIGCPSRTVAAAEGVPGIPKRIAETDPPVIPPIYVPSSKPIAGTASRLNDIGSASARATVKVSPGIDPKINPTKEPSPIAAIDIGVKASANAFKNCSIMLIRC
jgi:hypothetical protein